MNKLALRVNRLFEVITKVGDNAYKVTLPDELEGVSTTLMWEICHHIMKMKNF